MMNCPFLSQLPKTFLANYGSMLTRQFGQHCPKLQALQYSTSAPTTIGDHHHGKTLSGDSMKSGFSKCPFLEGSEPGKEPYKLAAKEVFDEIIDAKDLQSPDADVFSYSAHFNSRLQEKKENHSYRVFKKIQRQAENFPMAYEYTEEKKQVMVWCSNDYLGMSKHPKVLSSASSALWGSGASAGGTRNISGNTTLIETLERKMAKLHDMEMAAVFTSCYNANQTALQFLGREFAKQGGMIFSDSGNHASMIQGISHSRVKKEIFAHNDPVDLRARLSKYPKSMPKLVAFETVHSMTGAVCPLKELCEVTKEFGGLSFVDEVHAVGLYGKRGGGIADRDGLTGEIDIITGTFGKAYGNMGGYIAGPQHLIDCIRQYGEGFIFTTALTPAVLAGCHAAVDVLSSPEGISLRNQHQSHVRTLREMLQKKGLPVVHCPSHILPIHVGEPKKCTEISNRLMDHGHYVQAINAPTVRVGEEKLRVAITPSHTLPMMEDFVECLVQVWEEVGLKRDNPCSKECDFCACPRTFSALEERHIPIRECNEPYCPSKAAPCAA